MERSEFEISERKFEEKIKNITFDRLRGQIF